MHLDDDFAIMLGARTHGEDVVIRIDRTEPTFYSSYQNGALDVGLIRCREVPKALGFVKMYEGEFVRYYEFDSENQTFTLLLDDGTQFFAQCDSITEIPSDLTVVELDRKLKLLSEILGREYETSTKMNRKSSRLDQMLNHEITKEINNLEAKRVFFSKTNAERAESITHNIQFCTRLLNMKEQIHRDEE